LLHLDAVYGTKNFGREPSGRQTFGQHTLHLNRLSIHSPID